ncbi:MAG: hypothetical protein ACE37F_34640 [Nannocystaceae bacterium]|nr:hypothetical protein [bacterium]
MRTHSARLLGFVSIAVASNLAGCYGADFDAALEGVYTCEIIDAADPDADCPSAMLCDGSRCVSALPSVEVRSPEAREAFDDAGDVVIRVVGSGLDLGADEGEPNAGYIEVTLDDQTVEVRSGPISDGIVISEFTVADTPGGHRISARALRPDGTPYGNPGASDTRLFWIDDGLPHVAITQPWPGSEIDLGTPLVDFEAAVLNFDISVSDTDPARGQGHVHLYYDDLFPACAQDPVCDSGYIAVVAASPGEGTLRIADTAATVPESPETTATITAVLRQNDHEPFCILDNPEDPDLATCPEDGDPVLVTDTITINRVAQE